MQHKVDHEVRVTVDNPTVTVTSLDHKIDKVEVWECRGTSGTQSVGTWKRSGANTYSKAGGVRVTPPPGAQGHALPEQDGYQVQFDLPDGTRFPICVDVYENGANIHGAAAETADVHRHCWLEEHGSVRHGGGFGDANDYESHADDYKGWYGLTENEESLALPAPANPHAP